MKLLFGAILLALPPQVDSSWSDLTKDADGVLHVRVTSSAQSKPVEVRILPPPGFPSKDERRFLYLLPVEKEGDARYGDPLAEARRLKLHEKYGMILVAPGFAELPWYADHPTNPKRRDEAHLVQVVLPQLEKLYPSPKPRRLLLGFSKSGWGAWSLLLRHPDLFEAASAWDAPLMKDKPDQFGMDGAFASQENFQGYQLAKLLRDKADLLRDRKRLVHAGYDAFRDHHQRMQGLLEELKIPVDYKDGPKREHVWGGGWIAEAAAALDALSR